MAEPRPELDEIIRRPELRRRTGLSDATTYRLIRQGKFPAPVVLAQNARGWRASQVKAWQESLQPAEVGAGAPVRRGGNQSPSRE